MTSISSDPLYCGAFDVTHLIDINIKNSCSDINALLQGIDDIALVPGIRDIIANYSVTDIIHISIDQNMMDKKQRIIFQKIINLPSNYVLYKPRFVNTSGIQNITMKMRSYHGYEGSNTHNDYFIFNNCNNIIELGENLCASEDPNEKYGRLEKDDDGIDITIDKQTYFMINGTINDPNFAFEAYCLPIKQFSVETDRFCRNIAYIKLVDHLRITKYILCDLTKFNVLDENEFKENKFNKINYRLYADHKYDPNKKIVTIWYDKQNIDLLNNELSKLSGFVGIHKVEYEDPDDDFIAHCCSMAESFICDNEPEQQEYYFNGSVSQIHQMLIKCKFVQYFDITKKASYSMSSKLIEKWKHIANERNIYQYIETLNKFSLSIPHEYKNKIINQKSDEKYIKEFNDDIEKDIKEQINPKYQEIVSITCDHKAIQWKKH